MQARLNLRKQRVTFGVPACFGHNARASNFEDFLLRLNIPADNLATTQDDVPVLRMEVQEQGWVHVQHARDGLVLFADVPQLHAAILVADREVVRVVGVRFDRVYFVVRLDLRSIVLHSGVPLVDAPFLDLGRGEEDLWVVVAPGKRLLQMDGLEGDFWL